MRTNNPNKLRLNINDQSGQAVIEGVIALSLLAASLSGLCLFIGFVFCKIWLAYQTRQACYCLLTAISETACKIEYHSDVRRLIPQAKIKIFNITKRDWSSRIEARIAIINWEFLVDEKIEIGP